MLTKIAFQEASDELNEEDLQHLSLFFKQYVKSENYVFLPGKTYRLSCIETGEAITTREFQVESAIAFKKTTNLNGDVEYSYGRGYGSYINLDAPLSAEDEEALAFILSKKRSVYDCNEQFFLEKDGKTFYYQLSHTLSKRKNKKGNPRYQRMEPNIMGQGGAAAVFRTRRIFKLDHGKIYAKKKNLVAKLPKEENNIGQNEIAITQIFNGVKGNGVDRNAGFFTPEMPGKSLDKIDFTKLSFKQKINLCIGILRELKLIHDTLHIHRDLKLNNIMYDETTGQVYIIDHGFTVKPKNAIGNAGTICYLAPELFEMGQATFASDIYACAGVFAAIFANGDINNDTTKSENRKSVFSAKDEFYPEWKKSYNAVLKAPREKKSALITAYINQTKKITAAPFYLGTLFPSKEDELIDDYHKDIVTWAIIHMSANNPKERTNGEDVLAAFENISEDLEQIDDKQAGNAKSVKTEKTDKQKVLDLIDKRIKELKKEWLYGKASADKIAALQELIREINHPKNEGKTLNKIISQWEHRERYISRNDKMETNQAVIKHHRFRLNFFQRRKPKLTTTQALIAKLKQNFGEKYLNGEKNSYESVAAGENPIVKPVKVLT